MKKISLSNLVFSTDPNFKIEEEVEEIVTLLPSQQPLKVWLDTKQKAGKVATVITGFIGKTADADNLCKQLKNLCATGGNFKDNEILVQGNHREKIILWLIKNGYAQAKKVGK
jgi:translation initiation factor 1